MLEDEYLWAPQNPFKIATLLYGFGAASESASSAGELHAHNHPANRINSPLIPHNPLCSPTHDIQCAHYVTKCLNFFEKWDWLTRTPPLT